MPLLSALQPLFAQINAGGAATEKLSLAESRQRAHRAMEQVIVAPNGHCDPLEIERDFVIPVAGGEIRARLYGAKRDSLPMPCHLYFHGGGFWLGTLEHFDAICRRLAKRLEGYVLAVDYRLAPEHRFPTPVEDCYAALCWVAAKADELGLDPAQISVGGLSAGGNFAAVVALMARDRGGPAITMQVLEAPVTDLSRYDPLIVADEALTIPSGKEIYCEMYLREPADAGNPYVSPLLAEDLTGLPPALVMCAEYDPLAAEGWAYADRLEDAGVPVVRHMWQGQFHGSQQMAELIPAEAEQYETMIAEQLRSSYVQIAH